MTAPSPLESTAVPSASSAAGAAEPERDSASIVFLHAHPDDEAIFTGGTMALLAGRGVAVTVVFATDDPGADGADGRRRRAESEAAAAILGIDRVEFLGYADSGMGPGLAPGCFAATDTDRAAERLVKILEAVDARALVCYEPGGIYGHPDHLAVHRVGHRAAALAGTATVYESTVDREHLHFVATHLVDQATESLMVVNAADRPVGLHPDSLGFDPGDGRLVGGTPTVLIDLAVDVAPAIRAKRASMAAHASQIPPEAEVLTMDDATFNAVYGHEWYLRHGPLTALDQL